jgi:hypothetical protein
MSLKRRLDHNSYTDETGEVLPYADIQEDLDSTPPSDSSIAQGMFNLETSRKTEAQLERFEKVAQATARIAREQAVIDEGLQNPGVYTTLEQRFQNELDLMNIVAGANQRGGKVRSKPGGFEVAHRTKQRIKETYGDDLPQVAAGAKRNLKRMENSDPLKVYQAQELIDAGIGDEEEIKFDARTQMKNELRTRFYDPNEDDRKRTARRRYLNKKLAQFASK